MIQFAPSEIALIQLFEGSIPIDNDVAPVVVLSEIKVPPAEAIETETLAIFLMVISLPAPTVTALGKVMVCPVVEPVNTNRLALSVV